MPAMAPLPLELERRIHDANEAIRYWTDERADLIRVARTGGASLRDIADVSGLSRQTVDNITKRRPGAGSLAAGR